MFPVTAEGRKRAGGGGYAPSLVTIREFQTGPVNCLMRIFKAMQSSCAGAVLGYIIMPKLYSDTRY